MDQENFMWSWFSSTQKSDDVKVTTETDSSLFVSGTSTSAFDTTLGKISGPLIVSTSATIEVNGAHVSNKLIIGSSPTNAQNLKSNGDLHVVGNSSHSTKVLSLSNTHGSTVKIWDDNGPNVGTFTVSVRSMDDAGAMAIFMMTRNTVGAGHVTRVSSVRGRNDEDIDLEWSSDVGGAVLRHRRVGELNTDGISKYVVHISGV